MILIALLSSMALERKPQLTLSGQAPVPAAGLMLNAPPGAMTGGMKFDEPGKKLWSRSSPLRFDEQPLTFWTMKTVPSNVLSWKFLKSSWKIAKLNVIPDRENLPPIS